jgi:predicted ATPase
MITSAKVNEGFAADLPALKDKTFNFTPGLNVLFGPNGCGKSTLLKIISGYCFCGDGGWSRYASEGFPVFETEGTVALFPGCMVINRCKAVVEWDGTSSYYNNATISDAPINVWGMTGLDMRDEVSELMSKPSEGMKRLDRLGRMIKELESPVPDILKEKARGGERFASWLHYINGLERKGPATVILDEPDRCLSIENQALLWGGFANVVKKFQVIVASHSLLPILRAYGDPNIIDMEKGYLAHSTKILSAYMQGENFAQLITISRELREADAKIAKMEKEEREKKEREKEKKERAARQTDRKFHDPDEALANRKKTKRKRVKKELS